MNLNLSYVYHVTFGGISHSKIEKSDCIIRIQDVIMLFQCEHIDGKGRSVRHLQLITVTAPPFSAFCDVAF